MLKERDEFLDKVMEICCNVIEYEKFIKYKIIKLVLYNKIFVRLDFVVEDYVYEKVILVGKVEWLYWEVGDEE